MTLYSPPQKLEARQWTRMPETFRRRQRTSWADANRHGEIVDCFLEGPSFDRAGNLYVTDIPFGRIFRIAPDGHWAQVAEYDGWPNGLKIDKAGSIVITDHKRGLLRLDPANGKVTPLLETRHSEGFKGVNDLVFASNGDIYFTDQGQTGLQDPTGRVYRLRANGQLDCLVATVPSPNGIVLNRAENQVYIAVTRGNAVWRLPLMGDGSASKVGLWIQLSGGVAGPDGMALDAEGGLVVCQLGMGVWHFDSRGRPTHLLELTDAQTGTNVAFGGPANKTIFVTESATGSILCCDLPVAGKPLYSHQ